jgi:hypothetical protein
VDQKLTRTDVQDADNTEISDTDLYEREFSVRGHVILGIRAEGAWLRLGLGWKSKTLQATL